MQFYWKGKYTGENNFYNSNSLKTLYFMMTKASLTFRDCILEIPPKSGHHRPDLSLSENRVTIVLRELLEKNLLTFYFKCRFRELFKVLEIGSGCLYCPRGIGLKNNSG